MSKISDLATTLTNKYGLSTQDAEAFITAMFDVINDQLQNGDKSVKVKKLGTFKVTSVSSRESVNVNTGERILIEGRNKISFTPDTLLKDRVNKPFSQFETVALNDGVDFNDIENVLDEEKEGAPVEEQSTKVEEQKSELVEEQSIQEEEQKKTNEITENLNTTEPMTQNTEQQQPDVVPTEQRQAAEQHEEVPKEQHEEHREEHHHHHHHSEHHHHHSSDRKLVKKIRTRNVVIIILLILIAVMAAVGYRYFNQYDSVLKEKNNRILELEIIMDNLGAATEKKDTVAKAETPKPVVAEPQSKAEKPKVEDKKNPVATPQKPVATAKKPAEEKTASKNYNADPRVRTGAYVITGIERTVTLRKGQTLRSISRALLGNGMECYVEAVNDKREYKEGDKVNIPSLKIKKIKSKK